MKSPVWLLLAVLSLSLTLACAGADEGGVGAPCEEDSECETGLSCDTHDDHGTCQTPHEH